MKPTTTDEQIPALSIRQPWAFLIAAGIKDIENRDWKTKFRGRFFVHASKTFKMSDYRNAMEIVHARNDEIRDGCRSLQWNDAEIEAALIRVPDPDDLKLGGIIGLSTLVDCVKKSDSIFFDGWGWGFVLKGGRRLPFVPISGKLKFWTPTLPNDLKLELGHGGGLEHPDGWGMDAAIYSGDKATTCSGPDCQKKIAFPDPIYFVDWAHVFVEGKVTGTRVGVCDACFRRIIGHPFAGGRSAGGVSRTGKTKGKDVEKGEKKVTHEVRGKCPHCGVALVVTEGKKCIRPAVEEEVEEFTDIAVDPQQDLPFDASKGTAKKKTAKKATKKKTSKPKGGAKK
jgi:hypothetical protein